MYPKLLHIYGPFEINSFNAALMLGILLFLFAARRDRKRKELIDSTDFLNIVVESALAGIVGGRLLHILSEWNNYHSFYDVISVWNGGLSILGALMGVLCYSVWALNRKHIPILPLYDIGALYSPLIHAVARIGCFLVGCCYGCPTTVAWGITYTHPLISAPLHIKIHPTQLYSSAFFFGLFFLLVLLRKKFVLLPGQLACLYIMGMSFERFIIDFFRGDRIPVPYETFSVFSFHQWIALSIFVSAFFGFIALRFYRITRKHMPHESV